MDGWLYSDLWLHSQYRMQYVYSLLWRAWRFLDDIATALFITLIVSMAPSKYYWPAPLLEGSPYNICALGDSYDASFALIHPFLVRIFIQGDSISNHYFCYHSLDKVASNQYFTNFKELTMSQEDSNKAIVHFLARLLQYKGWIIGATLISGIAAVVISLYVLKPYYQSFALVYPYQSYDARACIDVQQ